MNRETRICWSRVGIGVRLTEAGAVIGVGIAVGVGGVV